MCYCHSLLFLPLLWLGQGAVQTFSHYVKATTLQGTEQVIPLGPAASQIAIKQLGTNGGGFFWMPTVLIRLKIRLLFPTFWKLFSIIIISAGLGIYFWSLYEVKTTGTGDIYYHVYLCFAAGLAISLWSNIVITMY